MKKTEDVIKKCKYAGDPDYEPCNECNGISFIMEEKDKSGNLVEVEHSAVDCEGYEAEDEEQEAVADTTAGPDAVEDEPAEEKYDPTKDGFREIPDLQPDDEEQEDAEQPSVGCSEPHTGEFKCNPTNHTPENKNPSETITEANSVVKEITAQASVTIERNNSWYKIGYSETRVIKSGCTAEEVEAERTLLWDKVFNEVDSRMDETIAAIEDAKK